MKTVLILDKMPEACGCCPCVSYNRQAKRWECDAELLCRERYATVKVVDEHTRPSWCRLRPLPEEKHVESGVTLEDANYIWGWNECLDEVVGYCLDDEREDEE